MTEHEHFMHRCEHCGNIENCGCANPDAPIKTVSSANCVHCLNQIAGDPLEPIMIRMEGEP